MGGIRLYKDFESNFVIIYKSFLRISHFTPGHEIGEAPVVLFMEEQVADAAAEGLLVIPVVDDLQHGLRVTGPRRGIRFSIALEKESYAFLVWSVWIKAWHHHNLPWQISHKTRRAKDRLTQSAEALDSELKGRLGAPTRVILHIFLCVVVSITHGYIPVDNRVLSNSWWVICISSFHLHVLGLAELLLARFLLLLLLLLVVHVGRGLGLACGREPGLRARRAGGGGEPGRRRREQQRGGRDPRGWRLGRRGRPGVWRARSPAFQPEGRKPVEGNSP